MVAVARREVVAVARREVVAVSPPLPNKPRNVQYFNIVIDPIWSWVGT